MHEPTQVAQALIARSIRFANVDLTRGLGLGLTLREKMRAITIASDYLTSKQPTPRAYTEAIDQMKRLIGD